MSPAPYQRTMTAPQNHDGQLHVGDKCRLSDLGRNRNPQRGIGLCEVVSFGISAQRVRVRFAGHRTVQTLHASYLERVTDGS